MSADRIQHVTVTAKRQWTPTLFSFCVTRPDGFRFTAGQFVRLGIEPHAYLDVDSNQKYAQENSKEVKAEPIFRAYSIVSSPYDEHLEFFSVVMPEGAFTSRLQYMQVGDTLLLDTTPYGYLTLARFQSPAPLDLWLLATGTGVAPFLSMLADIEPWQRYERIILVYSVRWGEELAYLERIRGIAERMCALTERDVPLIFIPVVTREVCADALTERITTLLATGKLEERAGHRLNAATSHVMLCGNPQMVEDTKEQLKLMGLTMNRRGEGNIAVENYW